MLLASSFGTLFGGEVELGATSLVAVWGALEAVVALGACDVRGDVHGGYRGVYGVLPRIGKGVFVVVSYVFIIDPCKLK